MRNNFTPVALMTGALFLSGCSVMDLEPYFPRTVNGFQNGGLPGAIEGAAGAIVSRCELKSHGVVRIAVEMVVDKVAPEGVQDRLEEVRQDTCEVAQALDQK